LPDYGGCGIAAAPIVRLAAAQAALAEAERDI